MSVVCLVNVDVAEKVLPRQYPNGLAVVEDKQCVATAQQIHRIGDRLGYPEHRK